MCGIVGFTGEHDAAPILLESLEKLEYRGYDSAGVSFIQDGELKLIKRKGKVAELKKAVAEAGYTLEKVEIDDVEKFLYHLNCILPDDVKVFELKKSNPAFHAQKSAKYKHYRYKILNDHVASVFDNLYLFYPYHKLDIERLNQSLSYLIGHHDFSSFKSHSDNPYDDCIIYYAHAFKTRENGRDFILVDIIGNRFLYNMVRSIVGELLLIERKKLPPKTMEDVLKAKDRTKAGNVIDAHALSLVYVGYDDVDDYIKQQQKEGNLK